MNPIALQLANGNAYFVGLGMFVVSLFLRLWLSGRIFVFFLRICIIAGMTFVILSATPLPFYLYFIWFVLSAGAAVTVFGAKFPFARKVFACLVALLIAATLFLIELPYHLSPAIEVSSTQTIYVIGDSISAGLSNDERAWPKVLGDTSHLKIVNLAKAAASVESAMDQSKNIGQSSSLILVEIGGNDFLGHTDSKTFYRQLDALLGKLHEGNNRIVLFELPLFPFCNDFGKAQREMARKYDAVLVPKHYLTDVFGLDGGTVDGLHLSQKGHNALAESIYRTLKIN